MFKTSKNNPRCDVHTLQKEIITERLYLWLQVLGGLVCLCPIALSFYLRQGWKLKSCTSKISPQMKNHQQWTCTQTFWGIVA